MEVKDLRDPEEQRTKDQRTLIPEDEDLFLRSLESQENKL
jgi:hypothetical protein